MLQAYAFLPFGFIQRVLTKVRQSQNLDMNLVAPFWPLKPWFPDLLELLVEVPVLLPMRKDLLKQPYFHHYHRNLPVLRLTGFHIASDPRDTLASLCVAHQLTFCRCSTTLVNYQVKWVTYHSWCRTHGHPISRPSISKIADFLLYLRLSLHLSYSSVASYRSMLSAVFSFVLPGDFFSPCFP